MIKNLELPEEDLFLSLGKHLRQYIKRSVKENLIGFRILEGDEILANPTIMITSTIISGICSIAGFLLAVYLHIKKK